MFLVVIAWGEGGMPLASIEVKDAKYPTMYLKHPLLPLTFQQEIIQPKMSIVPKLRKPAFKLLTIPGLNYSSLSLVILW